MAKKELTLLHKIEREVLAEGREWMKKRMEERLEELAEESGEVSPPEPEPADQKTHKPGGIEDGLRDD